MSKKSLRLRHCPKTKFLIFSQLCQFVLDNSQNAPLVGVTLETLLRFLNWIPLGYIFETKLIDTLIFKFLSVPMFRNVTLKCLTEIAAVTVPHYDNMFVTLFTQVHSSSAIRVTVILLKYVVLTLILIGVLTSFDPYTDP